MHCTRAGWPGVTSLEGTTFHMLSTTLKRRMAMGLAAVSLGSGLVLGSGTTPAAADPKQLSALVGAGSDTTQEVINAMAGFSYQSSYTPVNSGATGNYQHIASWDATPAQTASDNCITPVINGPTFTRPNGSGSGQKALHASATSAVAGWTGSTFTLDNGTVLPTCATAVNIGGTINFARSSSLRTSSGSDIVFVPFARDAMSFATYRPGGGTALTTLTRKNIIDMYSGSTRITVADPDGSGTVTIVPCGIQTGSGTYATWLTKTGADATMDNTATSECNLAGNGARIQESKGEQLKAKGDALYTTGTYASDNQLVVLMGFAASAYIAQANGAAPAAGYSDITLGGISDNTVGGTGTSANDIGRPVSGSAGSMTPSATFYADSWFGRDVYNVIRRSNLVNTGSGAPLNNSYVALFADTDTDVNTDGSNVDNSSAKNSSKICQAGTTIERFGFGQISNCGDYTSHLASWNTGAS